MIHRGLGILIASFILTACGGSDSTSTQEVFTPDPKSIETVAFVDALNKPLTSADVVFIPESQEPNNSLRLIDASTEENIVCDVNLDKNSLTAMTDEQGDLTLQGLAPGDYQVNICKADVTVSMQFTILNKNAATAAVIAAPLTVDDEGVATELPEGSIIVAVSGVIYSDEGVIANAQVAISGGTLTNGAITTAITDDNGFYSIVINVNANKLTALQNATIQIVAEGFESLNIEGQDFTQFSAFSGVNIKLTAVEDDVAELAYEENFEILSSNATCGEWTSEALNANEINLWHTHVSGLAIVNQAYIANLVSLAPNDDSEGKVPDPIEGSNACWYGKTSFDGSVEEGNFLNEVSDIGVVGSEIEVAQAQEETGNELNGGTSAQEHAGALISPRIDFSNESTPLSLTFKTWWEIEAVNPNENGYDIMSVEYQIEGEDEWVTLVRLNPLADPVGIYNLESLPYSSTGFNRAPLWLEQAPISLDSLAGQVFKLRFSFSTQDNLFNGFRGWLLDDVKISYQVGTFPLLGESDRIIIDEGEAPYYDETFNDETEKTQFTTSLTIKSLDSVSAQLRFYSLAGQPLFDAFAITSVVQGILQDIELIGDATEPDGEYKLAVELVDASGQVKAIYTFYDEAVSEQEF